MLTPDQSMMQPNQQSMEPQELQRMRLLQAMQAMQANQQPAQTKGAATANALSQALNAFMQMRGMGAGGGASAGGGA
jgi:hypothetical protein